jgi:hypothetical protein
MKKFLCIIVLFSGFTVIRAQTTTTFGVGAGINIANVYTSNDDGYYSTSDKIGFKGYAFAEMKFTKYFSVETDLGYDGMGYKINVAGESTSLNYLTLSVLPKIHIKHTGIAFFGGPSVGFLLNSVFKRDGVEVTDYQEYHSVEVFAVLGMEYFSPVGLGISLRLVPGLTDIGKNTMGGGSINNAAIGITLAYKFK